MLDAVRVYCNQNLYDSEFVDKLFQAIIQKQKNEGNKLSKGTMMSLLKTVKDCRYNNPDVLEYLCGQILEHKNSISIREYDFIVYAMYIFSNFPRDDLTLQILEIIDISKITSIR